MKNIRKALAAAFMLCILAALFPVGAWADHEESVVITPPNEIIYSGGEYTIAVKDTATELVNFEFEIYNAQVTAYLGKVGDQHQYTLKIDSGFSGELPITAKNEYDGPGKGDYGSVKLNVVAPATTANLQCYTTSVAVNEPCSVWVDNPGVTVTGWNATAGSISNGVFTCDRPCTATIYAEGRNQLGGAVNIAPLTITVNAPVYAVEGVDILLDGASVSGGIELAKGRGVALTAKIIPEYATNKDVQWFPIPDNGSILTVNEYGFVTRVADGEAWITVRTAEGGFTDTVYFPNPAAPTPSPTPTPTISLPDTLSVFSGRDASLTATLSGADGYTVIDWTKTGNVTLSDAASYSGVSVKVSAPAGITTAETATVTATVRGTSVSKTCRVTIVPNGVKHIDLTSNNYYPKVGDTITVTADIKYSTPGDQITAWKFDSSILQCTEMTGSYAKFKALKAGQSKVTAVSDKTESFIDITVGGGALINHQITYGNYATFDGSNPLYFITNEAYGNFKGVTVDGYALTNGNQYYVSARDGYILIAMNPAYLKMLSSSNYHTIQIYSTVNQPATGYFRTYSTTQTIYGVKTGDENNIALWVTLGLIGFAGAAAIVLTKRKEIFGK